MVNHKEKSKKPNTKRIEIAADKIIGNAKTEEEIKLAYNISNFLADKFGWGLRGYNQLTRIIKEKYKDKRDLMVKKSQLCITIREDESLLEEGVRKFDKETRKDLDNLLARAYSEGNLNLAINASVELTNKRKSKDYADVVDEIDKYIEQFDDMVVKLEECKRSNKTKIYASVA